MKILALDLGTKTGYATVIPGDHKVGTWELVSDKTVKASRSMRWDRRLDLRAAALWRNLMGINGWAGGLDWILFEDVRFGKSLAQVQLWSSFRGIVWAFAEQHGLKIDCLETGKLKIHATGSGAADKPAMARALVARWPDQYSLEKGLVKRRKCGTLLDDNAVDALWLLAWGHKILNHHEPTF
jgi:Holliday junction resolvasome RuvABC endonuclease subunit